MTRIVCVLMPSGDHIAFIEGSSDNSAGMAKDRNSAIVALLEQARTIAVRDLEPRTNSLSVTSGASTQA